MAGDRVVRRRRVSRAARQRSADRRLRPRSADPGGAAGRRSRHRWRRAVASPIERQLTTIAGIDSMTSQSGTGNSEITLQFDLGRSMDSAVVDVQTALSEVMPLLPAGMPNPPTFRKQNPADQDIMQLSLTSSSLSMSVLDDYAETVLAPRISMVNGVSQVQVQRRAEVRRARAGGSRQAARAADRHQRSRSGAAELERQPADRPAVRPAPDVQHQSRRAAEQRRRSSGRSSSPTGRAGPCGSTRSPRSSTASRTRATPRGSTRARAAAAPSTWASSGSPAPTSSRSPTRSARVLPAARGAAAAVGAPAWCARIGRGPSARRSPTSSGRCSSRWCSSSASSTCSSTTDRRRSFPALALPFSILGTFAVMKLLNFSLNNLSMMALILSIGFVVDDAIVMLENIVRHIEAGEDRLTASLKGSKEIGFTILTMTTSLAAVFIPILFMSGILGRLFREFAVTITAAILISGVVSITLTPMLCSRFLRVVHTKKGLAGLLDRAFDSCFDGYRWSLGLVLRHRFAMVVVFVAVLAGTVHMYGIVPEGIHPRLRTTTSCSSTCGRRRARRSTTWSLGALRAAEIIKQNPNIDSFDGQPRRRRQLRRRRNSNADAGAAAAARASAQPSAQQIAQQLRPQLLRFPNYRAFVRRPAGAADRLRSGQQQLQRDGAERRHRPAVHLGAAPEHGDGDEIPEIQDVSNNLEIRSPKVNLVIDRDKAAAVGLNATQIENTLSAGLRPEVVVHDLRRRRRSTACCSSSIRSTSSTRIRSRSSRSRRRAARSSRCRSVVSMKETVGPQSDQPLGPAARRCRSRSRCARASRSAPPSIASASVATQHAAGDRDDRLRGLGEGVSGVHEEPRPAALRRDRRRLHRARRAVRELHPPDHDSLGPAVSRPGRARSRSGRSATS